MVDVNHPIIHLSAAPRVCHSPLFVNNIFGRCFIESHITLEDLKCNFRIKNIFPRVPSRGSKSKILKFQYAPKALIVGAGALNVCLEMPDSISIFGGACLPTPTGYFRENTIMLISLALGPSAKVWAWAKAYH